MSTSQDVVDLRMGTQLRLSTNGGMLPEKLSHLGIRIFHVAENESLVLAGLDTCRLKAFGKSLVAEGALLYDTS
jgi:hypothetical protein